jgi:hypothetical protein
LKRSKLFDSQLSEESIYHRSYKKRAEPRDKAPKGEVNKKEKKEMDNAKDGRVSVNSRMNFPVSHGRGRGCTLGNAIQSGASKGENMMDVSSDRSQAATLLSLNKESNQSPIGLDVSPHPVKLSVVERHPVLSTATRSDTANTLPITATDSTAAKKQTPMTRPVRERNNNEKGMMHSKQLEIQVSEKHVTNRMREENEEGIQFDEDLPPLEDLALCEEDEEEEQEDDEVMASISHYVNTTDEVCSVPCSSFLF